MGRDFVFALPATWNMHSSEGLHDVLPVKVNKELFTLFWRWSKKFPWSALQGSSRKVCFLWPRNESEFPITSKINIRSDTCITKPQEPLESNSREKPFSSRDATQLEKIYSKTKDENPASTPQCGSCIETLLRLKYRFPTEPAFWGRLWLETFSKRWQHFRVGFQRELSRN